MVSKEAVKAEIDSVPREHLEVLFRIVKALETPLPPEGSLAEDASATDGKREQWLRFISETYGSLADDPIQRGDQGKYEVRESFR